jgi:hypothetical protein
MIYTDYHSSELTTSMYLSWRIGAADDFAFIRQISSFDLPAKTPQNILMITTRIH